MNIGGEGRQRIGLGVARSIALMEGRLNDYAALTKETGFTRGSPLPDDEVFNIAVEMALKGPAPATIAQLEAAIARIPFRDLPMVDRPYLVVAVVYARAGLPDKARAMIARYRTELTDTSLKRAGESNLHEVLAEIAIASGKPIDAIAEFRRGDIGYDGAPVDECAPCLPFNLARAYDAAGQADSAVMMFERYLSTPYWLKAVPEMDPLRLPAIRERLGQLYESMGKTDKAIENYTAFIDLWKKADPELQPRVADAKRRLAKLTQIEKPR
jgi:tetratricopeptide (TPR) repeat protein